MVTMTKESVELKAVKVYVGMSEGTTAFTATLYINGKKAAHVKNDGRGGDNYPRFLDRTLEEDFHSFCKSLPPRQFRDTTSANENGLTKCCEALTTFHDSEECCKVCFKEIMEPYPMNYDSFIGDLLDEWIDNDQWKKACRKGLVFFLKSDEKDNKDEGITYRMTKGQYSAILAKQVREKHGEDLLEIVNERFI